MRKRDQVAAMVFAGVLLSSGPSRGASSSRLVLELVDSHSLLGAAPQRAAKAQVVSIFAGIDVDAEWSESQAGTPELLVYLRPNWPEQIGLAADVLGAAFGAEGRPRVLFLFLPTIADVVGVSLHGGMMSADAERKLARAVARVIVHEAFHAVAPELPHAPTGLTSADLTRHVLLRGKVAIQTDAVRIFRSELSSLGTDASFGR